MDITSPFDPFAFDDFETSSIINPFQTEDNGLLGSVERTNDVGLAHGTPAESVSRGANKAGQKQHNPERLTLVQIDEWDQYKAYNDDPPNCIHYTIEWKVTVNNRMISKDTEQDLVLAPGSYWQVVLEPKLQRLLNKKLPRNKYIRCDDTNIVVSVTGRSERDLVKRFEETDIDWPIIEKQLEAWGELFRVGKRLRVEMSFNYIEVGQQSATTGRKGEKRGSSATQHMLSERAALIEEEQDASGQPSIWRNVYNLMRCPGSPCNLGPHCWRDPVGKKHYKLKSHHFKNLISFVEEGHKLETHDDVPEDVREQLYSEEQ